MRTAHTFIELYEQLKLRLVPFLVAFFATVFVTYLVLYIIDFYPEPVEEIETVPMSEVMAADETEIESESLAVAPVETIEIDESERTLVTAVANNPLPLEISFDELDRTVPVLNPTSADYATLDAALLKGVVRHPESADLKNTGNMLILGHSSYLPNVMNRNFQAFNGMQKLQWGDTVRVTSADAEYVYRVDRVYQAPASNIVVPVGDDSTPKLTLVTCNVLGAKEDRYILEASLVETVAFDG